MQEAYQVRSDSWLGRILVYNSLPSTNSHILQHLSEFHHLDVVMAYQQTAGRGRHSKKWESIRNKSLTFSLVFDLSKLPKLTNHYHRDSHTLPQILALSLTEFLELFYVTATLKWPNDILVKKKKLAGILSEIKNLSPSNSTISTVSATQAKLIIGIGINLNHSAEEFDQHSFEATSLKASLSIKSNVSNKDIPPLLFLERYLSFTIPFLNIWIEEGFNFFIDKYKKRCDLLGKVVQVKQGNQTMTMKIKDLDSNGFLKVKGPNGNQLLTFGEIIT